MAQERGDRGCQQHVADRGGDDQRRQQTQPPGESVGEALEVTAGCGARELGRHRRHDRYGDQPVGELEEDEGVVVALVVRQQEHHGEERELVGDHVAERPSREPDDSLHDRVTEPGQEPQLVVAVAHRPHHRDDHRRDAGCRTETEPQDGGQVALSGIEDHVVALELHPDDGERDDGHEIRQDRSERSGAVPPRRVQVGRRQAGDCVEEDLRQHQVQQIGDDLQLDERGRGVAALGGEPAVQVVVDREGRGEGQEGQERGRDESDRDQDRRRLGVVLLPGPDEQRDERRRQHPADHELEDEVRRRVRLGVEVGEWGLADGIREDEHAGEPGEPAQSGAGGHPDALASGATGGGADRVGRHGGGPDVVGH